MQRKLFSPFQVLETGSQQSLRHWSQRLGHSRARRVRGVQAPHGTAPVLQLLSPWEGAREGGRIPQSLQGLPRDILDTPSLKILEQGALKSIQPKPFPNSISLRCFEGIPPQQLAPCHRTETCGSPPGLGNRRDRISNPFFVFQHNLCCDNCHSHVALALNLMRYDNSTSWNMVKLCFFTLLYGKYVR